MAARRGKTQARRNQSQGGLPGWAWMVIGIVLTVAVVLLAPKWLKSDGDGLWRPQPNPDARPARAADAGDEATDAAPRARPRPATPAEAEEGPEYDFYTLLPGKEVALSDSELAATERAEAQREALREAQLAQSLLDATDLPAPVNDKPVETKPAASAPTARVATAPADGVRYLLQAGAFQAAAQAEELKARIALLGLGAWVESAQIDGKAIHRVRMGPYDSASALADAKRKLASGGLPAMAIKNDPKAPVQVQPPKTRNSSELQPRSESASNGVRSHSYCADLAEVGRQAFASKREGHVMSTVLGVVNNGLSHDPQKQMAAQFVVIGIYGDGSITSGAQAYDKTYTGCR